MRPNLHVSDTFSLPDPAVRMSTKVAVLHLVAACDPKMFVVFVVFYSFGAVGEAALAANFIEVWKAAREAAIAAQEWFEGRSSLNGLEVSC